MNGGGGTTTSTASLTFSDGTYSKGSFDDVATDPIYSDGYTSSGSSEGSSTGHVATTASGQNAENIAASVPSYTSSTINVQYLDYTYLTAGNNYLANGLVVNCDPTTNTATATNTINGITYTVKGSLESDGDTVDVTMTQSNGYTSTAKYAASKLFPHLTTTSTSTALRHAMAASTVGKVGAVVSFVGAVVTAAALIPTPASPVLAVAGAVITVVGAGVSLWDAFRN